MADSLKYDMDVIHHIREQVREMLANAVANGYPHDYERFDREYVEEMLEQGGIEGFDSENTWHMLIARMVVSAWRKRNPKPVESD